MAIKKKAHEKLDDQNILKVIKLLEADKPITKTEACRILNIAMNTKRLAAIIAQYKEKVAFDKKRRAQNRGKPPSDEEIKLIISDTLAGEGISNIAKVLFRSPNFVKAVIENSGVPIRPSNSKERSTTGVIPEECMAESFEEKELVWSATHHKVVEICKEICPKYSLSKIGLGKTDYEKKYGCKAYTIFVEEDLKGGDEFFLPALRGGFYSTQLACDLGSLQHLKKYGINLTAK